MKSFFSHTRMYIFRGLLAVIPLAITFFAIQFLYVVIDRRVVRMVGLNVPGVGILLVLLTLYLLGVVASNVLGKQIFHFLERVSNRIPLVRTTYQVGKQLASTFSIPGRQVFKKAVLVEYLKPGMWTLGFVTGSIVDAANGNETLLKVFVPTPPNPASGTMIIVREVQTRDPGCSIEDAIKTVVSGGIIGIREIR